MRPMRKFAWVACLASAAVNVGAVVAFGLSWAEVPGLVITAAAWGSLWLGRNV